MGVKLYIDFLKKSLLEENCVLFSMEGSIFLGQQYSFVSYDQIERTSQKYRRIEQASRMKVSEVGYVCLKRMRETEIPLLLFSFYFMVHM